MNINLRRPDHLCWITIPFLILAGLFAGSSVFDVYLHDTYYAIEYRLLLIAASVFLGLLGFAYQQIIRRRGGGLMPLVNGHLWLTLACAALLYGASAFAGSATEVQQADQPLQYSYVFIVLLISGVCSILLVQLLFIISVLLNFFRG